MNDRIAKCYADVANSCDKEILVIKILDDFKKNQVVSMGMILNWITLN